MLPLQNIKFCVCIVSKIIVWLKMICVCVLWTKTYFSNCASQARHDITWSEHNLICVPLSAFFLRLLLPYERHIKGEQDKPLPLAKPRKQEVSQDKAPVAKVKAVGAKKLKGPNTPKPESKKERETVKDQEQSQVGDRALKFNLISLCSPNNASPTVMSAF